MVTGLHVASFTSGVLSFKSGDGMAVRLVGSWKTVRMGLDIGLGFGVLVILSVIASFAVQLILNTLLVDPPWPLSLAPEWLFGAF